MVEHKSIITNRRRDCYACRLVSGFGLMGIGAYVARQGFPMQKGSKMRTLMFSIGMGVGGLGVARLLELPPFNTFQEDQS